LHRLCLIRHEDAVSGLCIISALSALIVYVAPDYEREGITQGQISDMFTYPSLFLGIGNIISMPIAVAVGRRPVILASAALLFLSAIICATNQNYHWHLGGRMLAALSAAQCQSLAMLIIQVSKLYFSLQKDREKEETIEGIRIQVNDWPNPIYLPAYLSRPKVPVLGVETQRILCMGLECVSH